MSANQVTVLADWDGDGTPEDDISSDVKTFTFTRGRDVELGRTQAGTCELLLRNEDGRYSPDNQASPLYGEILPGVMVQAYYSGISGDVYLFTGKINEFRPNPRLDAQVCYVYAVDGMDALSRGTANVTLQDNIKSGVIIADILDDAGWPALARTISDGEYIHPWVYVSGISALEAINQLEALEYGARCFVDGLGNFVWQDSLYRDAIAVSTLTVDNTNTHIEATFNLLNVWNEITCQFTPPAVLQPDTVIFTLQNPVKVDMYQKVTLYCGYQYPCKNATFIKADLGYFDANSQVDGLGYRIYYNCFTLEPTFYSTYCSLDITNNGGYP